MREFANEHLQADVSICQCAIKCVYVLIDVCVCVSMCVSVYRMRALYQCVLVCVCVCTYQCMCACVRVCVCVLISVYVCVCMHFPPAAGEDVPPSDPRLQRALSLLVFPIIDSHCAIDSRRGRRKGKIGV